MERLMQGKSGGYSRLALGYSGFQLGVDTLILLLTERDNGIRNGWLDFFNPQ
jgi:hypothetical protein